MTERVLLILNLVLILGLCGAGAARAQTESGNDSRPETEEETETETETEKKSDSEFSPEIEALLNEPTSAEGYGAMERCITVRSIRSTDVLDDRHIVFELPAKKYYLVQFQNECHRLRRDGGIAYEPRGSQLCRLDYVKAIDNLSMGDVGPPCSIPGFYEVSVEQVAFLKEALKAEHRAEVEAYRAEKAKRKAEKKAEKAAAQQAAAQQAADSDQ